MDRMFSAVALSLVLTIQTNAQEVPNVIYRLNECLYRQGFFGLSNMKTIEEMRNIVLDKCDYEIKLTDENATKLKMDPLYPSYLATRYVTSFMSEYAKAISRLEQRVK